MSRFTHLPLHNSRLASVPALSPIFNCAFHTCLSDDERLLDGQATQRESKRQRIKLRSNDTYSMGYMDELYKS